MREGDRVIVKARGQVGTVTGVNAVGQMVRVQCENPERERPAPVVVDWDQVVLIPGPPIPGRGLAAALRAAAGPGYTAALR